jgi:hypothetical protein
VTSKELIEYVRRSCDWGIGHLAGVGIVRRGRALCDGHSHNARDVHAGIAQARGVVPIARLPERACGRLVIVAVVHQRADGEWRIGPVGLEGRGIGAEDVENAIIEGGRVVAGGLAGPAPVLVVARLHECPAGLHEDGAHISAPVEIVAGPVRNVRVMDGDVRVVRRRGGDVRIVRRRIATVRNVRSGCDPVRIVHSTIAAVRNVRRRWRGVRIVRRRTAIVRIVRQRWRDMRNVRRRIADVGGCSRRQVFQRGKGDAFHGGGRASPGDQIDKAIRSLYPVAIRRSTQCQNATAAS